MPTGRQVRTCDEHKPPPEPYKGDEENVMSDETGLMHELAKLSEVVYRIPFTQYIRPDGRKKATAFEVTGATAVVARELIGKGCRFEVEVLSTGEVSMTSTHDDSPDGRDLAIEVCENGPAIDDAIIRLVAWTEIGRVEMGQAAKGANHAG